MAVSNEILSTTLRALMPDSIDNLFRTTPILSAMKDAGGIEELDGGQRVEVPVQLVEHSNISQLSSGYEPVSLSVADIHRPAIYEWCDFVAPVVITKKEETSNKGPRAIVKIAETRMKNVMGLLKREASAQLIAGNSTVLTELSSLNGVDAATGFFEELAFGTQGNTVGQIPKSSFPAAWQNQVDTAGGAFATNGLNAMSRIAIQIQTYAPEGGLGLVLASPASYALYRSTLQLQERYMMSDKQVDGGRMSLLFHGAPVEIEPNLGFTGSGGTIVSMYFLNPKLLHIYTDKDAWFQLGDFEHVTGYASRSANVLTRMQIGASHLASQGILLNAEA